MGGEESVLVQVSVVVVVVVVLGGSWRGQVGGRGVVRAMRWQRNRLSTAGAVYGVREDAGDG
jgi:hypothetical protein